LGWVWSGFGDLFSWGCSYVWLIVVLVVINFLVFYLGLKRLEERNFVNPCLVMPFGGNVGFVLGKVYFDV